MAVALGVYGRVHDPSQKLVFTLFFSSTIAMKVWFATVALAFAVVQVMTRAVALREAAVARADWLGSAHRMSGRLAFIISLPVAYHCLWSLGFQDTNTRVLAHSLLGCAFYGAFAAKVLIVRSRGLPGLGAPVAGGLVFAVLVSRGAQARSGSSTSRGCRACEGAGAGRQGARDRQLGGGGARSS